MHIVSPPHPDLAAKPLLDALTTALDNVRAAADALDECDSPSQSLAHRAQAQRVHTMAVDHWREASASLSAAYLKGQQFLVAIDGAPAKVLPATSIPSVLRWLILAHPHEPSWYDDLGSLGRWFVTPLSR